MIMKRRSGICKASIHKNKGCQCLLLTIWKRCYRNKFQFEKNCKMTWKKWGTISPGWWTKFKITKPISPDWSIKCKSIRPSSTLKDKISIKLSLKWDINCMKKPTGWKTLKKQPEVSDKYKHSLKKDTSAKKITCKKSNLSFKTLSNTFLNSKPN